MRVSLLDLKADRITDEIRSEKSEVRTEN